MTRKAIYLYLLKKRVIADLLMKLLAGIEVIQAVLIRHNLSCKALT